MVQKLNQLSGMPKMMAAFTGWQRPITLTKVTQDVVNGLLTPTTQILNFMGTVQPLSPKEIALKPEGQRAWPWLQIHCLNTTLQLTTNDQIVYNGTTYKIMGVLNYHQSGFLEFHAVEDYQT